MKKYLFSIILSFTAIACFGTHFMGGEITVLDIGNGKHQVVLLAYRDTIGIPMQTSATFNFNGPQGLSFTSTTGYDSIISGNLLPMYPYGVEVYLFVDTVSFPAAGHWEISWSDCCRNEAIQNLASPLSDNMFLKTSLTIDSVSASSTPFFLVPAAIFLPIHTPWQYNPLPFDPDGDSLSWSIDTPLTSLHTYCSGYTHPSSDTSNPFSIDPVTGTISWTANTQGNFVASILVDQYRNGQWTGRIRRDMQFIVVSASHGHPVWSNLNSLPTDSLQHYSFDLVAGESFKMDMTVGHTDSTRNLYMQAFSEILQNPQSGAHFSSSPTGSKNELTGTFTWTPQVSDIRPRPYLTVFRASDAYFTDDKAVKLKVNTAVGLKEQSAEGTWSMYPNPTSEQVFIRLDSQTDQSYSLEVYSLTGSRIYHQPSLDIIDGQNIFGLNTYAWQAGAYVIKLTAESGTTSNKMLIVK